MKAVQFDPTKGAAFQGDVVIMALPPTIEIDTADEIPMRGNMLVLAEGEVTGHHHAIRYGLAAAARFRDEGLARSMAVSAEAKVGTSRMYRDPAALAALLRKGILTTDALFIGFLRIEGECPPLTHDEHGPIQIPPGDYYVGGKREMDAATERRVAD